ncbi:nucleotidyltransferase domain-containing protein [Spirosoma spitsbergense]|uniref:nucleotidyltransferase domain-containing protein n=1 Tax=Spirosoma spitsbergense TaxID=431554 RepID=UPI0003A8AA38|nr:nucleotidyltransferase family protein [Spirosoma spitsbergense]
MKVARSPELTLLLMACMGELSTEKMAQLTLFLQQHLPDWDRLLKLAAHHRLIPFLYRTFRETPAIPTSFLATLRQECQTIATDNLLKLHEYKRVAALLTSHNIEHISFKGIYLAEHSYPQSSLRPIGDIDILVAEKDLYEAVRILAPDGYQMGAKYQPYLRQAERVMLDELHEISLFKPFYATSRFDIDLHWRVNFLLREIDSFQLHDILYPDDHLVENQVILLVLHHGINNLWERIGYINDLYFMLRSTDIDWTWLLDKLKRYKLDMIFFVGLYWCKKLWGLPALPFVQPLMPANHLHVLAEGYERKWDEYSLNSFRRMLFDFAKAQTLFTNKLTIYAAYSRSFIFRSSLINIKDRQLYIPKEWGFTTVLIRAILALRRHR